MKKLVLAALLATGCGGYRIYLFPVVEVEVVNDCKGSSITLTSARGVETRISYGNQSRVVLERRMGSDGSLVMTVRGTDSQGRYLGSDSRSFYVNQNGSRQEVWHIRYLSGGLGCGR